MQISGDGRNVPRRERAPLRSRTDNYVANNWYWGDPNLTDETDIFDRLHVEDARYERERIRSNSIQRWNGRL